MRVLLSACRAVWLTLGFCLIAGQLPAQQMTPAEQLVVGTWVRRCDATPGVTDVPRSLFTFGPDRRYTNVAEMPAADTLTTTAGTWVITDMHLMLNSTVLSDTLVSAPIVWVSDDLFYTIGEPDADGASVFAYFQRVTGSLKRRLQLKPLFKKARK